MLLNYQLQAPRNNASVQPAGNVKSSLIRLKAIPGRSEICYQSSYALFLINF
jgi:hypothetical protein